jgi:nucleoid-associated protein YgaU
MISRKSRYAAVEQVKITDGNGREIPYLSVRFIPATGARVLHSVNQGERLDHIAHRYYKDPERFWRICDANEAMWPDELVEQPGRKLLIPPAEG